MKRPSEFIYLHNPAKYAYIQSAYYDAVHSLPYHIVKHDYFCWAQPFSKFGHNPGRFGDAGMCFYGMGKAQHICHSLAIAVAGYSFPKYSSPATSHSTNPYLLIFDIL